MENSAEGKKSASNHLRKMSIINSKHSAHTMGLPAVCKSEHIMSRFYAIAAIAAAAANANTKHTRFCEISQFSFTFHRAKWLEWRRKPIAMDTQYIDSIMAFGQTAGSHYEWNCTEFWEFVCSLFHSLSLSLCSAGPLCLSSIEPAPQPAER